MNFYSKLPYKITVGNKKYRLNPTFDRVIEAFDVLKADEWTEAQKIDYILWLLVKTKVKPGKKADVLNETLKLLVGSDEKEVKKRVFDFSQDFPYILSAFLQTYNINLLHRRKWYEKPLHFWEFLSLFQGLPNNTKFNEVLDIRVRPLPKASKYNKDEITQLLKLKRAYSLIKTEEEKEEEKNETLKNVFTFLSKKAERGNNGKSENNI